MRIVAVAHLLALAACAAPTPAEPDRADVRWVSRVSDHVIAGALIDGRRALVDAEGLPVEHHRFAVQSRYDNLLSAWRKGHRARREFGWDQNQGTLERTERDLDLAIDGIGFFRVIGHDTTTIYTRDGSFQLDGQGNLLLNGSLLDPPVTIPENVSRVFIDTTGLIQGFDPTNVSTLQSLGQLQLVRFVNPEALASEDGVFFRESVNSGAPIVGEPGQNGFGLLRQGFLEESNVDELKEALDLVAEVRRLERMIALYAMRK